MKRSEEQIKLIDNYISQLKDEKIALADNWVQAIGLGRGVTAAYELSFVSRVAFYLLKRKHIDIAKLQKKAEMYLAFEETVKYLTGKGVDFYFVQRVSGLSDYEYSATAKNRMQNALGFPVMSEDYDKYSEDFSELIGERASAEYVESLAKVPQIVFKGDKYAHEDYRSDVINVFAGERVVPDSPAKADKKLHLYGRCGVFGYAVSDSETMPNYLQKKINEKEKGYKVINHGLWGGDDSCIIHNFIKDSENMSSGDTVVFYLNHFDSGIMNELVENGLVYSDITDKWHEFEEAKWCFYDRPGHMNRDGYRNVAELIYELISEERESVVTNNINASEFAYRENYLKNAKNEEFDRSVEKYIEEIRRENVTGDLPKNCGAIVMNCNPFTNGHRYLIEYAASKVEWLWIFVVEEDRSVFKFTDRFEMVKNGTADLANVHVVPSGNFIISTLTFPEYFMKDYVKEKDFDISNDLTIFATKIAPALNIHTRFAGEEPMDPVTANYNENMAVILPKYGMEFCEIKRLELEGRGVINATRVRELIKENNLKELEDYLPETTIKIVKEKYI